MTALAWTIDTASLGSLVEILKIEEACFSAPWTRKMLEAELRGNPFAHFLVARQRASEASPQEIIGYLCYWLVFEEVRLMNLAVIESMRHRGIAKSLVAAALRTGMSQSAHRAVLEVRASNRPGQRLYEGFGFSQTAIRPRYYANPEEDAVLMELEPIVVKSAGSVLCHEEGGHQPLQ
jgi:ribosomal-protein-alanine N-acetyltransferase